jgi:hypothetical protein
VSNATLGHIQASKVLHAVMFALLANIPLRLQQSTQETAENVE